jgi:hypothetical protein
MPPRTHPSGRDVDRFPSTGTPESRALARELREHSRLPDMQTDRRAWAATDDILVHAEYYRPTDDRRGGWIAYIAGPNHDLRSPGYAKTLRTAFRALARRLVGRPVVHTPRSTFA